MPRSYHKIRPRKKRANAALHVWLVELRKKFPTREPVVLRFDSLREKSCIGYCESDAGGHVITIDDGLRGPLTFFLDTLIHEYAHALQWEGPERNRVDHDAAWGIIYARLVQWAYDHRLWPE